MNQTTDIHPEAILEVLLAKGKRSNRQANLKKMNALCQRQYEAGSRDFSLSTIGRLVESEGIMKGRTLYNVQSSDYKYLIEAWASYAGPPMPKPPKVLASHEYLLRIEDPAIRSIMQAIIAERDKLKAQVNTLKAHTQLTIDRRPQVNPVSSSSSTQPLTILAMVEQLTPSEREALHKAVSQDYLGERGLTEGSHGEILNERGRTIFEVGFTRAIRKVLGN